MDTGLLSIAKVSTVLQQVQVQSAMQTQLLRNAMDSQAQNVQALLQGMAGSTAMASHPYLGNSVDVYV
jgi:hypothetical protein